MTPDRIPIETLLGDRVMSKSDVAAIIGLRWHIGLKSADVIRPDGSSLFAHPLPRWTKEDGRIIATHMNNATRASRNVRRGPVDPRRLAATLAYLKSPYFRRYVCK